MNDATVMYQIAETNGLMMSFVIITKQNNVIVIDGGRPEDMPTLKEHICGRRVSAWILTHPHDDHISGFIHEIEKNGGKDFNIERVYYNFPPYNIENRNVSNYEAYKADLDEILPAFLKIEPKISDKSQIVKQGSQIKIDECKIDFIYTYHQGLNNNYINDSSLVFKLTTPNKSVMFLSDLGPDGGDVLFRESRHLLKADIVQMAHHGHGGVGMEVYAEIMPKTCLWCCGEELYNESEIPNGDTSVEKLQNEGKMRMYGTGLTRKWMDVLGADKHYVTKDGTNRIEL